MKTLCLKCATHKGSEGLSRAFQPQRSPTDVCKVISSSGVVLKETLLKRTFLKRARKFRELEKMGRAPPSLERPVSCPLPRSAFKISTKRLLVLNKSQTGETRRTIASRTRHLAVPVELRQTRFWNFVQNFEREWVVWTGPGKLQTRLRARTGEKQDCGLRPAPPRRHSRDMSLPEVSSEETWERIRDSRKRIIIFE